MKNINLNLKQQLSLINIVIYSMLFGVSISTISILFGGIKNEGFLLFFSIVGIIIPMIFIPLMVNQLRKGDD